MGVGVVGVVAAAITRPSKWAVEWCEEWASDRGYGNLGVKELLWCCLSVRFGCENGRKSLVNVHEWAVGVNVGGV